MEFRAVAFGKGNIKIGFNEKKQVQLKKLILRLKNNYHKGIFGI